MHLMDHGTNIDVDIEEKQVNLGQTLIQQELFKYNEDFNQCEIDQVQDVLYDNHIDFRNLYKQHYEDIINEINSLN